MLNILFYVFSSNVLGKWGVQATQGDVSPGTGLFWSLHGHTKKCLQINVATHWHYVSLHRCKSRGELWTNFWLHISHHVGGVCWCLLFCTFASCRRCILQRSTSLPTLQMKRALRMRFSAWSSLLWRWRTLINPWHNVDASVKLLSYWMEEKMGIIH